MKQFLSLFLLISLSFAGEIRTFTGSGCGYTADEAVQKAISDALQQAAESGGVDIKGLTRVEDMALQNILILSRYLSKIKVVEPFKEIPGARHLEGDLICTKVRGKVEILKGLTQNWDVKISIYDEKGKLPLSDVKTKQIVRVKLKTTKPCYAYVFEVAPGKGYVDRLIPTDNTPDWAIYLRGESSFLYQVEAFNKKFPQNWKLIFVCSQKPIEDLRKVPDFDTNLHLTESQKFRLDQLEGILFKNTPKGWNIDFTTFKIVKD